MARKCETKYFRSREDHDEMLFYLPRTILRHERTPVVSTSGTGPDVRVLLSQSCPSSGHRTAAVQATGSCSGGDLTKKKMKYLLKKACAYLRNAQFHKGQRTLRADFGLKFSEKLFFIMPFTISFIL